MKTWKQVFTPKFTILLVIEIFGFGGAVAMQFTRLPFWISAVLCGVTMGFAIWAALEAADGRL